MRCDNLVHNEYIKTTTKKRINNGVILTDEFNHLEDSCDTLQDVIINELINNDSTGVLKLKMEGYTQHEISKMLNLSQPYVSQIIKKLKRDYNKED